MIILAGNEREDRWWLKGAKQRCKYSKEGIKTFGKQRYGYILAETKNGRWCVWWDDLKTTQLYHKDFIKKL